MRETKFRAWIIPEKRIADVIGLCYESDGKIGVEVTKRGSKLTGSNNNVVYWWKDSEAVLLEYTGLGDKDGVDVYEGNIVLCGPSVIGCHLQVVFEYGAFLQCGKGMQPDIWYDWDEVRVVGNIYENKDLLEEVI